MSLSVKQTVRRYISLTLIAGLKVYTAVTGAERARILVQNERDEVLLVLGFVGEAWNFPGGGIKRGEQPQAAAIRELYEEMSVSVDPKRVTELAIINNAESSVGYTAHIYTTKINSVDVNVVPQPREIIEYRWASLDSLPAPLSPLVSLSIKHLSK